MPAKDVWLFAAIFFVARLAHAGDEVSYQLELQTTAINVDNDSITRDSITLQDRTWATPGVEQSTSPLLPPRTFSFTEGPRFRIEPSEGCRCDFQYSSGPEWLDDAAWPLTRELWNLGLPRSPWDNHYEFSFRKCVVQR